MPIPPRIDKTRRQRIRLPQRRSLVAEEAKEFKIKGPGVYQLKFILYLERHDQGDRVLAKSEEFNFKYTKRKLQNDFC
jgi:hypothetical protein